MSKTHKIILSGGAFDPARIVNKIYSYTIQTEGGDVTLNGTFRNIAEQVLPLIMEMKPGGFVQAGDPKGWFVKLSRSEDHYNIVANTPTMSRTLGPLEHLDACGLFMVSFPLVFNRTQGNKP